MFSLAIFGGNKIDGGDLQPGERAVGMAVFGGLEMDFTATAAPFVEVLVIAFFGGVVVKVPPARSIRLTGFSLFGGRNVEARRLPPTTSVSSAASDIDDGTDELPLDINAFAVFGGVNVKRVDTPAIAAARAR
jgi:hypothetical protein